MKCFIKGYVFIIFEDRMVGNFQTHSSLGKASLILALLTVVFFVLSIVVVFVVFIFQDPMIIIFSSLFSFLTFIFSLISIILGAISYWGKDRDKYGLYGFVIGLVFMILTFVVPIAMAATVYVYVSGMISTPPEIVNVHLIADADENSCIIMLNYISESDSAIVTWDEIDWNLYNTDTSEKITTGVLLPHYSKVPIVQGQTIAISNLEKNYDYRFELIYENSIIGSVYWPQ